jgi:predicted DCC family thiol-disulfide oxidoreductase YuxK
MISKITVLFDAKCGFCCRCRDWMLSQSRFLDVEFMPKESIWARVRFPSIDCANDELVVIDDEGGIYRGPPAFLMCLYALVEYRAWSLRLSTPALMPLARRGFELVCTRRHHINEWLGLETDEEVAAQLQQTVGPGAPRCVGTSIGGDP